MGDNLLGGAFELSLRYLLLLDNIENKYMTEDRICCLDYMITYASDFDMYDYNLHGNNEYRNGEYWSRQALAKDALMSLVRLGLIDVKVISGDFVYSITDTGTDICQQMTSDYANEYIAIASFILHQTVNNSDANIRSMVSAVINDRNSNLPKGGNN